MIYLASKSPRRRELLSQINVAFDLIEGEVDESIFEGENGAEYCLRVACLKAQAGWQNAKDLSSRPVLGADTTVVCDNTILVKPSDEDEALAMLKSLSDGCHQVYSAVAIQLGDRLVHAVSSTEVVMTELPGDFIRQYVHSGESMGRAGAYSIQGQIAQYIKHLVGSYTGVVGLPLYETRRLLDEVSVIVNERSD